ncbi:MULTISPECIES: flagellar biosynthesis protein FlhF [Brevibacillus]|uniref:flagellar biosynthesis protein FlhF n=1 Tax=Brevibacillus TaxID=55080 RepID=UPI0015EF2027|nr:MULTISPECIES: flagellar biosynthesis protein FlhF [Brevibacillus]MBA4532303.1 flagellar biosynthesis protein FlhF [Brevibacillus halotolerans]MCR8962441.1 flagellar biosynthesis protein FlhF [Brevibacillus laterosporus]MCZ0834596.1 flagellar biosynthesis protein FlhF [Brevibacillus halotolerans]
MKVKRYLVESMPEALEKIRVELGKDAVILNTKQVKTGGFMGLFKKQQIEVIAAAETKEEKQAPAKPATSVPKLDRQETVNSLVGKQGYQAPKNNEQPSVGQSPKVIQTASQPNTAPHASPKEELLVTPAQNGDAVQPEGQPKSLAGALAAIRYQQTINTFTDSNPQASTGLPKSTPVQTPLVREREEDTGLIATSGEVTSTPSAEESSLPDHSQSLASSLSMNQTGTSVSTEKAHQEKRLDQATGMQEYRDMIGELKDMRVMLHKLLFAKQASEQLPPSLTEWREKLLHNEMQESTIATLLHDILLELSDPYHATQEEVDSLMRQRIAERIAKHVPDETKTKNPKKYLFFFGPTGVGKTTTIAKLAAWHMLKEKRKVGFITADTYRIAAVEQLKTYANILNVPLEVVFSANEMENALDKMQGYDLIFIDTAGRNYRNDEFVSKIKEYLQWEEMSEHLLVMSLTSKFADMQAIMEQFKNVPISQVILTKADETLHYGPILSLLEQFDLPLSYLTTGQNVPDDIEVITTEKLTKLIVGEEAYA